MKNPKKVRTRTGNKGGRPGSYTLEQHAWLKERLPLYMKTQAKGLRMLFEFWPSLFEAWFDLWPVDDMASESVSEGEGTSAKQKKKKRTPKEKQELVSLSLMNVEKDFAETNDVF
jgi:hypothetical protein